VLGYPLT